MIAWAVVGTQGVWRERVAGQDQCQDREVQKYVGGGGTSQQSANSTDIQRLNAINAARSDNAALNRELQRRDRVTELRANVQSLQQQLNTAIQNANSLSATVRNARQAFNNAQPGPARGQLQARWRAVNNQRNQYIVQQGRLERDIENAQEEIRRLIDQSRNAGYTFFR